MLSGRDGSGAAQYACVCDAGWSGASCELPSCHEFGGQSCAGHGTCKVGTGAGEAHQCVCDAGWQGAACAQPLCTGALGTPNPYPNPNTNTNKNTNTNPDPTP